jgi:DNA polymerase-3 subunit alpha
MLREFPARRVTTDHGELVQGLPVRLALQREEVEAQLDLGDAARFFPSDEAIERWRQRAAAAVVYDTTAA